ncbi:MAG: hydantoinase/oxoprolinase family protein, partial [Candidatus Thorarchaeota archaeon]
ADPGPASYGHGGTDATITDANIVLGRINPEYFVGGGIQLDRELANAAVDRVAKEVGLTREETALGIIRISTSNMVQAIREVTVERGHDPREFVLVPFGGAGPTQCVDIAQELGIERILIPRYPGITSAQGLVFADLRTDLMRTILVADPEEASTLVRETLDDLTEEARSRLIEQGAIEERVTIDCAVDMRYKGQSHEITIPVERAFEDIISSSRETFELVHKQTYGYDMPRRGVEWVTARVIARAGHGTEFAHEELGMKAGWPIDMRPVILSDGSREQADVYRRERLAMTQKIEGPAIVEQLDTTIYIPDNWIAEQNADGTMWLWSESS